MMAERIIRRTLLRPRGLFAAALLVALAQSATSGQPGEERSDEDQFAAAASYLQAAVEGMQAVLEGGANAEAHQLRPTPLLKYSDPARGYLAAGLWRLGKAGRPKGFVSAEYWAPNTDNPSDQPFVSFEFIPLSDRPFELTGRRAELKWMWDGSGPRPIALPEAPAPAESPRQRLVQMRNIVRRLDVKEIYRENPIALRLMTQPVDRYEDRERGIVDGAAFLFAHGTNPEILVLLECTNQRWQLCILRMSWAESFVELDGREIVRFPEIREHPTAGPYQTAGYALDTKAP